MSGREWFIRVGLSVPGIGGGRDLLQLGEQGWAFWTGIWVRAGIWGRIQAVGVGAWRPWGGEEPGASGQQQMRSPAWPQEMHREGEGRGGEGLWVRGGGWRGSAWVSPWVPRASTAGFSQGEMGQCVLIVFDTWCFCAFHVPWCVICTIAMDKCIY